jgi:hypothetical protein
MIPRVNEYTTPVPLNRYFAVPHKSKPMSARRLGEHICSPDGSGGVRKPLKDILDGFSEENTLSYFYKKAPPLRRQQKGESDHEYEEREKEYLELYQGADYIFKDEIAEEEFAELLGVKIWIEKPKKKKVQNPLTAEQIAIHKENIDDIREGLRTLEPIEEEGDDLFER